MVHLYFLTVFLELNLVRPSRLGWVLVLKKVSPKYNPGFISGGGGTSGSGFCRPLANPEINPVTCDKYTCTVHICM